jgi:hypothetical protein
VIADPPSDAGEVNGTVICRSPFTTVPRVGAPGATATTVTVGEEVDVTDPSEFVAVVRTRTYVPTKTEVAGVNVELVAPEIFVQVAGSVSLVQATH